MKILFICLSPLKFNVRTPAKEPLGGTESAICFLSTALAKLGHTVTLMRNGEPDENMVKIDDVLHMQISEDIAGLAPDVVILVSAPQAAIGVKAVVPKAKLVLWNHMNPDQPAIQPLFDKNTLKEIDSIVYVSDRQRAQYTTLMARSDTDGAVINNAISPFFENMFRGEAEVRSAKRCRGAYTSTPYRGLSILAHIKELPIDVYSSMKVYQGVDMQFERMFAELKKNDQLTMHGSVSQAQLARDLKPTAFLVYPCVFTECHSIALLEAMAAGMKVITTTQASPADEMIEIIPAEGATLESFVDLLRKNIEMFRSAPEIWAQQIWKQVQHVNEHFTWRKRAAEWHDHLQKLIANPS